MKRFVTAALTSLILAYGLTGCAENKIPDMTDEQMQKIGEYTAFTLMKYDAGQRSRLVDLSLLDLPENTEPLPTKSPAGMDPVDDTNEVNVGADSANQNSEGTLESTLGLPEGVSVQYVGKDICSSYPEDTTDFFVISAVEGKKLLVLNFSLMNMTGSDQTIDILSKEPAFRITVNGSYTRRAMMTMLENDFSAFTGVIPASQGETVVLVVEVEDSVAEELSSITLNLKNDSNVCTIQLE